MEHKICLDTDFLINLLKNKEYEMQFIKEREGIVLFATTYINLFELYYGAFKSKMRDINIKLIDELMWRIEVLNLSEESVKEAGEILATLNRNGEMIDFRDLLIGTIAMTNNFCIKTNNIKHFSKIPNIRILKDNKG